MKKITSYIAAAGSAIAFLPYAALAETPFERGMTLTNSVAGNAGITSQKDLPTMIGQLINIFLGFLGIVFLVLMIYAGFQWMTAMGDAKKVENAQALIKQAIIGLVVVIAAFAISNFVLGSLVNVSR
jgi:cytochrome bd-type quinol oxidase subunit 2